jgi:RecJ-like exonuclease
MNTYDKLLLKYVSKDDLRKKMLKPFEQGEFAIATDGHRMILIPKELCEEKYGTDGVDAMAVYNRDRVEITPIEFTVKQLDDFISQFPMEDECLEIECEQCEGNGTIHCDCCDNDNECNECNGDGHYNGGKTGKRIVPQACFDNLTILNGCKLNTNFLMKLSDEAKEIGAEKIALTHSDKTKMNVFKIENINVVIMPLLREDEDDTQYKTFKP